MTYPTDRLNRLRRCADAPTFYIRIATARRSLSPERLRPGETRQSLTERAAASFASLAQALRDRGHDPQTVAHFVNRLVFCMFADDVGLLPDHMFTRMLRHAQTAPAQFSELASELFRVMAFGGRVGFETVA